MTTLFTLTLSTLFIGEASFTLRLPVAVGLRYYSPNICFAADEEGPGFLQIAETASIMSYQLSAIGPPSAAADAVSLNSYNMY